MRRRRRTDILDVSLSRRTVTEEAEHIVQGACVRLQKNAEREVLEVHVSKITWRTCPLRGMTGLRDSDAQKTVEVSQVHIARIIVVPAVIQRQAPTIQTATEDGGKFFRGRILIQWWLEWFSQDKHQIVFRETADEHPDAETGDVLLVLQEQEHSVFNRNELFLVEALCCLELEITSHLDGRKLQVATPPGEIVSANDARVRPI